MSGTIKEMSFDLTEAVRNLITEDDEPVDNILSEKQQRLLANALYDSWTPPPAEDNAEAAPQQSRSFWVGTNVGIFYSVHLPGIAPDVFLSLDVAAPADLRASDQRSYLIWEYGKAPEVVIEIVSNRRGNELGGKLRDYARMGVTHYVVFDPLGALREEMNDQPLLVHDLIFGKRYRRRDDYQLPEVGFSLTLLEGRFEDSDNLWLRWADEQGKLILTAHERAERLAAKLRELGVDPDRL